MKRASRRQPSALLDVASSDIAARLAALPGANVTIADDDDNERRVYVVWGEEDTYARRDHVIVEVYRTHAGWCCKGFTSVYASPVGDREWNTSRAYPSRHEAASVASDYMTEALRLVAAWMSGVDLVAPDVRMRAAADKAIGSAERDERKRAALRVEWKRGRRWQDFRDPGAAAVVPAQGDLFAAVGT